MNIKKVTIVGAGYVGLSLAVLLSRKHKVKVLEIDQNRVEAINKKQSYLKDHNLQKILTNENLNLSATCSYEEAYQDSDFVILAVPTNFNDSANSFDTSILENSIEQIQECNKETNIFIKSTVPIGFTRKMREKYKTNNIYFSPEFLREGMSIVDNLNPSRIIVGGKDKSAINFSELLVSIAENEPKVLIMGNTEAESVKLFSNTYLAMRVSFFNELDSFALSKSIDAHSVIYGMGLDERIGNIYNNPSFGYGGYCLPKDSKQLMSQFENVPNSLMESIVESNHTRKKFLAEQIIQRTTGVVGVFRLVMKEGSDNFRESAVIDLLSIIKGSVKEVIIYEPYFDEGNFYGYEVINSLEEFKKRSSIIIANRYEQDINDVKDKVFTRDKYI